MVAFASAAFRPWSPSCARFAQRHQTDSSKKGDYEKQQGDEEGRETHVRDENLVLRNESPCVFSGPASNQTCQGYADVVFFNSHEGSHLLRAFSREGKARKRASISVAKMMLPSFWQ